MCLRRAYRRLRRSIIRRLSAAGGMVDEYQAGRMIAWVEPRDLWVWVNGFRALSDKRWDRLARAIGNDLADTLAELVVELSSTQQYRLVVGMLPRSPWSSPGKGR